MSKNNTANDPGQPEHQHGGPVVISLVKNVEKSGFVQKALVQPTFAAFVDSMVDPQTFILATKKEDLPLLIPAEFCSEHMRRTAHNVRAVHMLVLDIDHGTPAEQRIVLDKVRAYGHLVHTSYSHNPSGQHKRRAFIKLSRPVHGGEWRAFWPRAVNFFQALSVADNHCQDSCHMYYVPGGDSQKYEVYGCDGPALDVERMLALPLPEGIKDKDDAHLGYLEDLLPEERGEITENLRDYWDATLHHLFDEIDKRPYPGSFYDLKNDKVFSIAQGAPHIIDPERIRKTARAAIDRRYRRSSASEEEIAQLREKSFAQVDKAIEDGMGRPWWPTKADDICVRPQTDVGLGERLQDHHVESLRYVTAWKQWLVFTGTHWDRESGAPRAQELMINAVRRIPSEADGLHAERAAAIDALKLVVTGENRDRLETEVKLRTTQIDRVYKFALGSERRARIEAGLAMAASSPQLRVQHVRLDYDPWAFNVLNGTIDLRTGKLRPHERNNLITRVAPVEFHPDARAPRFEQFLKEVFQEDTELINYVLRILGYALTGLTTEHCMVIAYGSGCNGKTTLLEVVHYVMGPYAMVTPPDMLLVERRDSHPTGRASLFGVRLASTREIEEGRNLAEAEVKELTGGDPVTARRMYENYWTFNPTHKLWMSTNHLPNVRGTDEGIWRRLRAVPFSASFLGREDRTLVGQLRQEASGILAMLVRGCLAWQQDGLAMPPVVAEATARYRKSQDPIGPFLRECFDVDPNIGELGQESLLRSVASDYRFPKARIWNLYRTWAERTGSHAFRTSRPLHARLREMLYEGNSGGEYYAGIRRGEGHGT
jgi:putative DNA primase/helicase